MIYICEAECPDGTSPADMEEGVKDRKYDKNEKNDEEKEAEFLDDTFSVDIEEGVSDRKDDKNEKNNEEKEAQTS